MQAASLTSLMSAFARIRHAQHAAQKRTQAVFDDSCARELLSNEEYSALCRHIAEGVPFLAPDLAAAALPQDDPIDALIAQQFAPTPVFRARIAEDQLAKAVREGGVSQYVMLGAGLDTFAFRSSLADELRTFEVDHPLTQHDKRERIARAGWSVPGCLRFVEADLSKPAWGSALAQAGFDSSRKSFVSWLGVTYYLERAAIDETLAQLGRMLSPGSTLFFDFADEGLLASNVPRVKNMVAMAHAAGEPMQGGFSEGALRMLLEEHGFSLVEQWDPARIQEAAPKDSDLKAFEHIHFAKAMKG